MDFEETLTTSFEALTLNKTRTGLAILGIVVGIAAVIALMTLGQGSQKAVASQIQSLGSNLLTVSPGAQTVSGVRGQSGSMTTLTYEDAKAIIDSPQITSVEAVSAELSRNSQVVAGRNNTNTRVTGVMSAYAQIRKIEMESCGFLTQRDLDSQTKVAILGSQVVTDLFGEGANPVGKSIRINQINFKIIGVTQAKGGTGFLSQEDIIGAMTEVTSTFTSLLSGIAAISLLVGGIGIMNIMLVSVIERTREIGLRKALGAKKKDLITQFLMESVILTGAGGLLGVILGTLISFILVRLVNVPWAFSSLSYLLAFGVSAAIGIVFGFYPAYKASNLSPIEALRYE